jgi:hypothetical protein
MIAQNTLSPRLSELPNTRSAPRIMRPSEDKGTSEEKMGWQPKS